ncbi:MAG: NUDIX domain-containing protein [Actinomycetota bacterium]|nr:NUDIX domain-containing protein [Actinomycetota bacterium]
MTDRAEIAVGAVVIVDGHLLLVERGRPPAVGEWSVPGGRVEPGETLAEAVEREVLEETGLRVRCGAFIGWVERISPNFHFVIMDFIATPVQPVSPGLDLLPICAGDDASAAAWVPLPELAWVNLVAGLREFLHDHSLY